MMQISLADILARKKAEQEALEDEEIPYHNPFAGGPEGLFSSKAFILLAFKITERPKFQELGALYLLHHWLGPFDTLPEPLDTTLPLMIDNGWSGSWYNMMELSMFLRQSPAAVWLCIKDLIKEGKI